ncbi:hypothetical protein [Bradyrhizobium sp. 150]|uniref:hypothetical protein n=1 Tax=Bradyrhizobium sp. 150 TaxID=2782625 RepID=UPI001FFA4320|nr:hypothetical protein [Bradyrhizobium sp. 150]MCK1671088.1 hypothetical protein [Bradyrhizobium sp. 150]
MTLVPTNNELARGVAQALLEANGAILYWQLNRVAVSAAIAAGLAYLDESSDLLVHHLAVPNAFGGFEMPDQDKCQ